MVIEVNKKEYKTRLLVTASTYPRWSGDYEPSFVHNLCVQLTNQFDVLVLCPHSPGAKRVEMLDGVKIYRYRYAPENYQTLVAGGGMLSNLKENPLLLLLVPLMIISQAIALFRLSRSFRPDCIHAHWLLPQGLVVALLKVVGLVRSPLVVTSHGGDLFSLRNWLFRSLKRFVILQSDKITCASTAMVQPILELGATSDEITVAPMGADLSYLFTPDPKTVRAKSQLLFVGRLVEKKGLCYLLEALKIVMKEMPDLSLKVVGYGPEEQTLKDKVVELELGDHVIFAGAVPHDQLVDIYRKATLFVAPFVQARSGDQEGLGLVIVEALGCGCPVVVSDIPAAGDVVRDLSSAVIFRSADSASLAKALSNCLSDGTRLQREAQATVENIRSRFDWKNVGRNYSQILESTTQPRL